MQVTALPHLGVSLDCVAHRELARPPSELPHQQALSAPVPAGNDHSRCETVRIAERRNTKTAASPSRKRMRTMP